MNVYGYRCKCGRWESTDPHANCTECEDAKLVYRAWTDAGPRKLSDGRVKSGGIVHWPTSRDMREEPEVPLGYARITERGGK